MMPARLAARLGLALCTGTLYAPLLAQDSADIDKTQIIGNRELPKVLYIVPWKKPPPGELSGKPPNSVLDDLMAPIDRDVFRRHMSYDQQLTAARSAAANAAPAANR